MTSTVLLVDDDPIMQAVIAAILRKKHWMNVVQAKNGVEACEQIDSFGDKLSLLVCDINMPECDGIELIERMKSRSIRVPIIFVTGAKPVIARSATALAKAAGFKVAGTLAKPVNAAQLSKLVLDSCAA